MCSNVKDLPATHTMVLGPKLQPKETLDPNCALWHCVKGNIQALQNKIELKNRGNVNFDQTDDSLVGLVNFLEYLLLDLYSEDKNY